MRRIGGGAPEPYCLVLGGGGAKGVYHAGVWKALRELEIPVNAFVGNSVGALMAALLAQGDEEALYSVTDTIEIGSILVVPNELVEDGKLILTTRRLPFFRRFTRNILEHRGIDTTPLRKLLEANIDEAKIRNSGADLGMQTYNLSDLKPGGRFIDEIAHGDLEKYLLASAAVPGFVAPIIQGKKYVDGGVYDNVPYSMARRRGYRRIIAVDIAGVGVTRRPDIRGAETVYIKCSVQLGGILDFNRNTLDKLKRLGYLDTMRVFGRFHGYKYFIEPDGSAEKLFREYLELETGRLQLSNFLTEHGIDPCDNPALNLRQLFPKEMRHEKSLLLALLDCAAAFFDLPRIRSYTYHQLTSAIKEKKNEVDAGIDDEFAGIGNSTSRKVSRGIESALKGAIKREELDLPHYYYFRLLEFVLRKKTEDVLKARFSKFFPTAQAAEFLLMILDKTASFTQDD